MHTRGRAEPGSLDLTLDRVTKHFGSHVAVHELSLGVRSGEFVSLLGPSGCGKTSTLSMIAGFLDVTSGSIAIRGRRVEELPPERRNTGMVFQNYALFPHMTVAENIAFGLKMRRVRRAEMHERVMRALTMVRMEGFTDRTPQQLSGGQQQRIALARALVIEPDILLLDEPFGALDRQLREEMQLELKSLQTEVGITTIFVTHDQEEAMSMSDRVAVMNGGAIEQVGAPAEIYERPRTCFIARFMGKSNLFQGRIASGPGGGLSIVTSFGPLQAPPSIDGPATGETVDVLIRPEKVRLAESSTPSDAVNAVPATVQRVVYHGASADVHLLLAGEVPFLMCLSGRALGSAVEAGAAVGSQLRIEWDVGDTQMFRNGVRCGPD